jgi:RND family efflux transporter MFP subunit
MKHNFFKLLPYLCCLLLIACDAQQEGTTEHEPTPVAQVQTSKLEYTNITATLTAYGSVIALPNNLKTLSVPYASRIENVYVSNGQSIHAGDSLLTIQPSEDALLVIKHAQQELAAATQEQKLLQGRIHLKLATQHELVASQLRVDQAKALIQDLTARGSLKSHTLKAEKAGVISTINVQQGQRIAAGSPLLQWAEQNQWRVSLGIEPSSIAQLKTRQQVSLLPATRTFDQAIPGVIESIAQQIDPASHLLTVVVKPSTTAGLLLNESVEGEISLSSKQALVAPSAAVLPDEDGYSVYTVLDNHAIKHRVKLGTETDTQVEVIDPTLNAQDVIVMLGNYELTDGMAVEVQQP